MDIVLKPEELRVLGSLIEKESTTPEYYPLTLNSLTTACNQKSNRWPVADYADHDVINAIAGLRSHGFAAEISGGSRVPKYAQRFTEKLNMGRRETAILCVLMLRGQQTIGEIKGRTERMYQFADLDEVETVLHKLIERPDGALVQKLAPAPGMKEPRYAQTLGGPVEQVAAQTQTTAATPQPDRLAALEAEVSQLREEVTELKRRLDEVL
ncbi:MAG TPA: YceH family protein [Bryobacteraceae bacterium]|nr:YceH family protein [Bryobacteraceae bacterium]